VLPVSEAFKRAHTFLGPLILLSLAMPNGLDDATHSGMDTSVLDIVGDQPAESFCYVLLAWIVKNSEDRLDPKYGDISDAKDLLDEHPGLLKRLMVAWANKSFKEIRNLRRGSSHSLLNLNSSH
jgi:hypothetical protein